MGKAEVQKALKEMELAMSDLALATKRGIDQRELAIEIGTCKNEEHRCPEIRQLARWIVEAEDRS